MPTMPGSFRPRGMPTRREAKREADERRGSARERGYTWRWDKASKTHLGHHPLCAYCALEGRIEPATLVDHLYPHAVYEGVFWLTHWWVSACKPCHDGFKQAIERKGKAAIDALAQRLGRPVL